MASYPYGGVEVAVLLELQNISTIYNKRNISECRIFKVVGFCAIYGCWGLRLQEAGQMGAALVQAL